MSQVAPRAGQPVLEALPAHWGQRHEAARQARVQCSTPHTAMGAANASPVRPQVVLAVAAFAPPAAYSNELVREGGSPFSTQAPAGSDSTSGADKRQRISISMPTLGSSNATATSTSTSTSEQMAAGDEAADMAWHGEAAARGQTAAEGEAVADNRAARGDGTKKRKHQNKQNRRSRKATANRGESSQEIE